MQATPTEMVASPADAPPSTGYPPLQSVPPRPQLSYTVQQQRQIVEALVADRENARYTSQVVRYRSGLSSLAPPPPPPEKVVAAEPTLAVEEPAVAAPSPPEQETLIDFLATLRRQIFADEPEPAAGAPPPATPEAVTPTRRPAQAVEPAPADLPDDQELQAAQAVVPADQQLGPAPMPPARSSVAARLVARPHLVDDVLNESIAQAPLPPGESAVAARQEAAPLAAPRPAPTRSARVVLPSARPLVLAPPPIKPVVPVRSPGDREPASDRSAALQSGADSLAGSSTRIIVTDVAS